MKLGPCGHNFNAMDKNLYRDFHIDCYMEFYNNYVQAVSGHNGYFLMDILILNGF